MNSELPEQVQKDFKELTDKIYKEHAKHLEDFTKALFVKAVEQAVIAGDFQRFIATDDRATIVYLPLSRVHQLEKMNEELARQLGRVIAGELVVYSCSNCGHKLLLETNTIDDFHSCPACQSNRRFNKVNY